ncbi:MAG: DNA repair protein RecO [Planctomycetota bacterium]
MSRLVRTRAIVLARYDWGNTSRVFTFLTPEGGRLAALLKGARRPKGRPGLGGGLDLLSENEILYYQRRTGLSVLAEWSEITSSAALGRDAVRFAAAEVCAEFARECTAEGQAEPEIYELLSEGVRLAAGAERLVPLAVSVALGMLAAAGLGPPPDRCAACGAPSAEPGRPVGRVLSASQGGLLCGRCARAARSEGEGVELSGESAALFGALLRMGPAAAARLRPSRRAENQLLRAVEHFASWRLERRMKGLSGLGAIIAGLETVGCR